MSAPRLSRAVAASAAAHLIVVAGLLALAHPRVPASPAMRVALVEAAGPAGRPAASAGTGAAHGAPGRGAVGLAEREDSRADPGTAPALREASGATDSVPPRATPSPPASRSVRRSEAQRPPPESSGGAAAADAVALLTPVQSDLWVLGGPVTKAAPEARPAAASADRTGASGASSPEVAGGGPAAAAASSAGGDGAGSGSPGSSGSGGTGDASLLAVLSQRLAWSAQRCAPPSVVRTARHAVPGVPLRFCLDAAGRPSEVGLLGTTGSDQLDRAARDCVIPGALPLPPVPGCYTVEVRFP
ncbi:MAG: hypothetical protein EHM78_07785, partial [Myxococcaceae bacterium]